MTADLLLVEVDDSVMTPERNVRMISGARKHGGSRRNIEQALRFQIETHAIDSVSSGPKIRYRRQER